MVVVVVLVVVMVAVVVVVVLVVVVVVVAVSLAVGGLLTNFRKLHPPNGANANNLWIKRMSVEVHHSNFPLLWSLSWGWICYELLYW